MRKQACAARVATSRLPSRGHEAAASRAGGPRLLCITLITLWHLPGRRSSPSAPTTIRSTRWRRTGAGRRTVLGTDPPGVDGLAGEQGRHDSGAQARANAQAPLTCQLSMSEWTRAAAFCRALWNRTKSPAPDAPRRDPPTTARRPTHDLERPQHDATRSPMRKSGKQARPHRD